MVALLATSCNWSQFGGGEARTGLNYDTGIELERVPSMSELWSATTAGSIESSPAIVSGRAFIGSSEGSLHAVDSLTGAPLWSAVIGGAVSSSPAVGYGSVYVGSDDHKLHSFDQTDGTPKWTASIDATYQGIGTSPLLGGGNNVFVASALGVHSYSGSDGSLRWSTPLASTGPLSSPSKLGSLVYVSSHADATVWALRPTDGTVAWTTTIPGSRAVCDTATASPAAVDGTVYVALCPTTVAPLDSVFALDAASGAVQWSAGSFVHNTSPGVWNGSVYVGSSSGAAIEALSTADGSTLWQAPMGGPVASSPAVAEGVLYVGSDDGKLSAFDAAGVENCTPTPGLCTPLWAGTTGGPVRSSPAIAESVVYVGSTDGSLYAYKAPPPAFTPSNLRGANSTNPTAGEWGPDGRLYVAQNDGLIKAYTIDRTAPSNYLVTATETIDVVQQIPNHDDDGSPNPGVTDRLITGLLAAGTAADPQLYVSSSDPRTGGGWGGVDTNLDTNSGIVSLVNRNGAAWVRHDIVRGLPRSEENHATNAIVRDPATNTLYVGQGGHTNMGAPSNNFNQLPEYAYSAAVLRIDLDAIGATTYDLPTLVDEDNPTNTTPFGGNGGKHQAKIEPGGPVQVHAPGFRNPFAVVFTRAAKLFAIDNGPNAGWGDVPVSEGPQGDCTNDTREPGTHTLDSVHLINATGYYAGHPNPTRANPLNTFNPSNPQSPISVANAVECDYRDPATNGSIATVPAGSTGAAEYTTANFGGQMDGDIFVANVHGHVDRLELDATGTSVVSADTILSQAGFAPVDVAIEGATDPHPGTIWVIDYAGGITVFEPSDFGDGQPPPCTGDDDTGLDEDGDGYSNADEIDNFTDPCSAGDAPPDWNANNLSDLNDPDDDGDLQPDLVDPFPIDPNNGLTTPVPFAYSWESGIPGNPCAPTPVSSGCPGGLLGMGFTGLMSDGVNDYSTRFDPADIIAGGAAGVLTVAQVTSGDALAGANTQDYAFHYGINTDPATTPTFTVHTQVAGPFAGLSPSGKESIGLTIGDGSQDEYAKLVISANSGAPEVQFVVETGGIPTVPARAPHSLAGLDAIDLYLTIDPSTATVQPRYVATVAGVRGSTVSVGGPTAIPAGWLGSTSRGLAVGIIATSAGGVPFPATWTLLETTLGPDGTWASAAPSGFNRQEVTYTYSPVTEKLYLGGGKSTIHEAYDPATDTWTPVAPLPESLDHIVAVEEDGLIYYLGGLVSFPSPAVGSVHIYDPVTDQFSLGAPMSAGRERGAGAVATHNGKIYYAGGLNAGQAVAWFDVYDPVADTWTPLPDMPEARDHFSGAVVGDRFHAIGGRQRLISSTTPSHDAFDFSRDQWVSGLAPLPTPRGGYGAAVLGTDILVIGGEGGGNAYSTVEVYDTATDTWTQEAPMPTPRHGILAAVCDGSVYVAAGGTVQGGLFPTSVQEVLSFAGPSTCGEP